MDPKEIAKGFEMKETIVSKRGIGFVAANGSGINNYGKEDTIHGGWRRSELEDLARRREEGAGFGS